MSNKAAKIVSDLLSGTRGRSVVIGGKVYFIPSPTIATICKVVGEFSQISVNLENPSEEELRNLPGALEHLCRGIAYAITADCDDKAAESLSKRLAKGTSDELAKAFDAFLQMASLQEVFQLAVSAMKYAETAARQK